MIEDHSSMTTVRPTEGFVLTTPRTMSQLCSHNGTDYSEGKEVITDDPCKHCFCMNGDIVCAIPGCGTPLENQGRSCVAMPVKKGACCPDTYICDGIDTITVQPDSEDTQVQQHIVPEKTGLKGVDKKRPFDKPAGPKVDKSSEEEHSGEDMGAFTTTESPKSADESDEDKSPETSDEDTGRATTQSSEEKPTEPSSEEKTTTASEEKSTELGCCCLI